ncbi:Hypothetical protein ETEE_2144 [Edwardsiella anguillarum ET080813]|uniref:Uncharacterized protein n=1 Tax=Edwardsiella anguillarum ET080813 TaxID=667120 RepID=A0A076LPS4_9GAMM|nr:Hypothetical protein ETEE_2144 [Edwardsiella anguillarum ET080813]
MNALLRTLVDHFIKNNLLTLRLRADTLIPCSAARFLEKMTY